MKLKGIIGQNPAVGRLEAEMAAGRLAHAYLFVGPRGVGRGSTARALFAALNCADQSGDEACGACDSCRRLAAGSHEDFLELAPPSDALSAQIKVESVREVIHTMSFAPFAGGVRMVLIRRAEHLNPASGNALLKILEEPPANNILVLTVQDPADILPTLVSRCRKVSFSPLSGEAISAELVRRGVAEPVARFRAALAAGSLGKALDLDEELYARRLDLLRTRLAAPGGVLEDWEFAEDLVRQFRGERIDREGLAESLDLLGLLFRDAAVAAAGRPGASLLEGAPPAAGPDISAAADGFAAVRRAQAQILGNAAPELALAVLLGRLRGLAGGRAD